MLSAGMTQVWITVPVQTKEKFERLRDVNPHAYSVSKLGWACMEEAYEIVAKKVEKLEPLGLHEPIVAVQPALRFKGPTFGTPGAGKRRPRK